MCNICNDPAHNDDLNDDLDDLFGGPVTVTDEQAKIAFQSLRNAAHEPAPGADLFYEPCPKCRGGGRFVSYAGRDCGPCFTCKGKGQIGRKTSKEARDAQAERKAKNLAAKLEAWKAAHPAAMEWLLKRFTRFDFAMQMMETLAKKGELSDGQLAAIERMIVKDAERDAAKAAAEAAAPTIETAGLDRIFTAFNKALNNQIQKPKMRLGDFFFSLAVGGANHGSIYVKSLTRNDADDQRLYLGKITDGKLIASRACSPEEIAQIVAVASNPQEAATAFGQRTGRCSICGIKLTVKQSVDRMVGPICWEKYFGD